MNYETIKTALDDSESCELALLELTQDAETKFGLVLESMGGVYKMKHGTIAELARVTGRDAKTLGIYSVMAYVWVNDLDPYITAREFRTIANDAVCHTGRVGMKTLKALAKGTPTVEEFVQLLNGARNPKVEESQEESQEDTQEDTQDDSEESKGSLLEVVLRALPHLTAEELATVADSVAKLATAQTLTLA
jgi:hypothetical protein